MGFSLLISAQGWMEQGARSNSLGGASVSLVDINAYHNNPGALGFINQSGVSINYSSRFLLKELQSQSVAYAQKIGKGVVSMGAQFYGYEEFRSSRAGMGYSLKLSENLAAGVQLNYQNLRLNPYYGSNHSISAEFGALLKLTKTVGLGFSVFNLGRTKLSEFQDDRYSTTMRLGLYYQVSKHLLIVSEINKEITFPLSFRGGMEYYPTDQFYFRLGAKGAPVEFAGGFGFKLKQFKLDISTFYHQFLGWTPGASLIFEFATNSND